MLTSIATSGWSGPKFFYKIDRERPVQGRPGARQIAEVLWRQSQVVDVGRDLGMIRTEALLADRERSLAGRPGARQIA